MSENVDRMFSGCSSEDGRQSIVLVLEFVVRIELLDDLRVVHLQQVRQHVHESQS